MEFRREFRREFPSEIPSEIPSPLFSISLPPMLQACPTGFPTGYSRRKFRRTPVGFRRDKFCDEPNPNEPNPVGVSVGKHFSRRKNKLFPSVFPSQIRCIFVVALLT